MPTDDVGVWLYAVIGGAGDRVGDLTGVAREPVRLLAGGDLTAVVGTVPLNEFGEEPLRRHLEDLDWLAAAARAHDHVISAVARSRPVLPVTMATVYLNDEGVRHLLTTRRTQFVAALDRVTGRDEVGVKAYADPAALAANHPGAQQRTGEQRSGTAYLMKRKRQLASQEQAYRVAAVEAERLHGELLSHAIDGKRKPASDPSLSGRDAWTVLNGTYLVDRAEVDAFGKVVAALQESSPGIELEVTGPWPPYSFAGDVMSS
jgi:hypothetical protein